MLLFSLLSCVWFRTNIAYERMTVDENHLHISETMRLFNMFGPTLHLELAPGNIVPMRQVRIGAETSLAPLLMLAFESEIDDSSLIGQILLFSSIGTNIIHYQYKAGEKLFGVFSPYVQIHSPPLCLGGYETDMTEGLCLTAYGEYQYQMFLQHPNELRFHVGLAIHYVIGGVNF